MRIFASVLLLSFIAVIAAKRVSKKAPEAPLEELNLDALLPTITLTPTKNATNATTELDELKLNGDFATVYSKHAEKCKCSGQSCLCCFAVPVTNFKTCISFTQVVAERSVVLKIAVENITAIDNESFLIAPFFQKCGILPPKLLNLNACLISGARQDGDDLKFCASFGLQAGPSAMSGIKISCITLKDEGLSFNGKNEVEGANVLKSWANPAFKRAVPRLLEENNKKKIGKF